eukprot:6413997-Pyramimonas_sp.AAC.1
MSRCPTSCSCHWQEPTRDRIRSGRKALVGLWSCMLACALARLEFYHSSDLEWGEILLDQSVRPKHYEFPAVALCLPLYLLQRASGVQHAACMWRLKIAARKKATSLRARLDTCG